MCIKEAKDQLLFISRKVGLILIWRSLGSSILSKLRDKDLELCFIEQTILVGICSTKSLHEVAHLDLLGLLVLPSGLLGHQFSQFFLR